MRNKTEENSFRIFIIPPLRNKQKLSDFLGLLFLLVFLLLLQKGRRSQARLLLLLLLGGHDGLGVRGPRRVPLALGERAVAVGLIAAVVGCCNKKSRK